MLFIDDFLEMVEELPQELYDRFMEIKRLDAQVQNGIRKNRDAANEFFETGSSLSEQEKIEQYQNLMKEFNRLRSLSEEKVSITSRMQSLLKKYTAHLDKEKTNLQMEMEADNPGVTVGIEKRYAEHVEALIASRKERKRKQNSRTNSSDLNGLGELSKESSEKLAKLLQEGSFFRSANLEEPLSPSLPSPVSRGRPPKTGNVMLSSTSIQNDDSFIPTPSGRRRSSTTTNVRNSMAFTPSNGGSARMSPATSDKSWSLSNNDVSPTSFSPTAFSNTTMPAFSSSESRHGRTRKLTSRVQEMFKEAVQRQRHHPPPLFTPPFTPPSAEKMTQPPPVVTPATPTMLIMAQQIPSNLSPDESSNDGVITHPPPPTGPQELSDGEEEEDSRRWCFCNEKSFGDMVACDNKGCPFQWFHYPCVGVQAPPRGAWFCPHCTAARLEADDVPLSPSQHAPL